MSTKHKAIGEQNKSSPQDWHRADIVATIWKRNSSLQRISREHGYHPGNLVQALHRPYPKAERIIAEFIGVAPQTIWPSRYHPDGSPRSGRGERGLGRYKSKGTSLRRRVNVHVRGGA